MRKEDFKLGDISFETKVGGVVVKIREDVMDDKTVEYAQKILELYLLKKSEIIEYVLNNGVSDFYKCEYTQDEIAKRLNEADIEIISDEWGILTWLNSNLDEHIIGVEFNNDLQLSYVSIDG